MFEVKKIITDTRVSQLKMMHELMISGNDENIYTTWIMRFPDEPEEEDYIKVASDNEEYNYIVDLFIRLISKPGWRW